MHYLCFMQELRITSMLDATIEYLDSWSITNNQRYEVSLEYFIFDPNLFYTLPFFSLPCPSQIVVVDDGSTDNTAGVVQSYMKSNTNQVLLLRLHNNRGKGAALKMGVRKSNGQMILIVSDGPLSMCFFSTERTRNHTPSCQFAFTFPRPMRTVQRI